MPQSGFKERENEERKAAQGYDIPYLYPVTLVLILISMFLRARNPPRKPNN